MRQTKEVLTEIRSILKLQSKALKGELTLRVVRAYDRRNKRILELLAKIGRGCSKGSLRS